MSGSLFLSLRLAGGNLTVAKSFYDEGREIFFLKIDTNGNLIWSKTEDLYQPINSVVTENDNIIVLTRLDSIDSSQLDLICFDLLGNKLWTKIIIETSLNTYLNDPILGQTDNDEFIITVKETRGNDRIKFIKVDSNGNKLWEKEVLKEGNNYITAIEPTKDEGFVVSGNTTHGSSAYQGFLVEYNSSGDEIWEKQYGGIGWDNIKSVKQISDDGFVIAGSTGSYSNGGLGMWVLKTDSEGSVEW